MALRCVVVNNYRSGYESLVGQDLQARGIYFEFEKLKIKYVSSVRGGVCTACGSKKVGKARVYTPDFVIPRDPNPEHNLIVEAKGRFPSTDKSKMRDIKKANPALDIRILFQKRSSKQASECQAWADKNGFRCAFGTHVPDEWLVP